MRLSRAANLPFQLSQLCTTHSSPNAPRTPLLYNPAPHSLPHLCTIRDTSVAGILHNLCVLEQGSLLVLQWRSLELQLPSL